MSRHLLKGSLTRDFSFPRQLLLYEMGFWENACGWHVESQPGPSPARHQPVRGEGWSSRAGAGTSRPVVSEWR